MNTLFALAALVVALLITGFLIYRKNRKKLDRVIDAIRELFS